MRKRLLTMLVLMLVAIGTLYTLNATSNAPNRVKNGFKRHFLPIESGVIYQLEFPTAVRELAGQSGDSLFLMTGEPGKVYVTDMALKKPTIIKLADPKIKNIVPRFYTTVKGDEVYILGGNAKSYAIGDLKTAKTRKIDLQFDGPFGNPVLIDNYFVASIVNPKTLDSRYAMIDQSGTILKKETNISKGKGDAGMVYSSLLKYDEETQLFVNLHYYDNGYEVFSKDLNLIRRGHTIDTTYNNPTQIFKKNGAVGYKHPPVAVSGYASTYKGKLYVRSKLLADNEDKSKFYANTAIDKYDIRTGKYEGSFYLPNINDEQVSQFYFLDDNKILALSDKQVAIYHLREKNFAKTSIQ